MISYGRAAGLVLLLLLTLTASAFLDAPFAVEASRAPHTLLDVGQFVTIFGTSEYMFAFSGLIAATALVALGREHLTLGGTSTYLLAGRAIYFLTAIAVSGVAAQLVKHLVGRARPVRFGIDGPFSFHPFSAENALASFPSGHTTSAFAAAVALGLMCPRWRLWLLGWACLIGASRVLVGAHYPSDIVAGAALGGAVALAMARVFSRGLALAPPDGLRPGSP